MSGNKKMIVLFRHAKAEMEAATFSDRERSLTGEGRNEALRVARRLKESGLKVDLILSSPALRAIETAEIIAGELVGNPQAVTVNEKLYDAPVTSILEVILQTDPALNSILLVGHNPDLEKVAGLFCGRHDISLPTSGAITILFESDNWTDLQSGKGVIVMQQVAKTKQSPEYQALKKIISEGLNAAVKSSLSGLNSKSKNKATKVIENAVNKLAKKLTKAIGESSKQDEPVVSPKPVKKPILKATPSKRGRKPAVKAVTSTEKPEAKKRGRKPAIKAEKATPVVSAEPKKRGRKPGVKPAVSKPVSAEPKKRGRKPAVKAEKAAPVISSEPKKRGRKPGVKPAVAKPTSSEPKKVGRKPAVKAEKAAPVVSTEPKKRGRKPGVKPVGAKPDSAEPKTRGRKPAVKVEKALVVKAEKPKTVEPKPAKKVALPKVKVEKVPKVKATVVKVPKVKKPAKVRPTKRPKPSWVEVPDEPVAVVETVTPAPVETPKAKGRPKKA